MTNNVFKNKRVKTTTQKSQQKKSLPKLEIVSGISSTAV